MLNSKVTDKTINQSVGKPPPTQHFKAVTDTD